MENGTFSFSSDKSFLPYRTKLFVQVSQQLFRVEVTAKSNSHT